ncbi:Uncharacterized protein PBTT_06921 [Plasmodiophora brassicae]
MSLSSDDDTLSWHDSSQMGYAAMEPPPGDDRAAEGDAEPNGNLTKYAVGATVGAAAVLILPTFVLVGAGVAAGAALAKSDKVSRFYEKHSGRSSARDSASISKALGATVKGAKSAGRAIADRFRRMASHPGTDYRSFGER